jgi:streptogramin lyase
MALAVALCFAVGARPAAAEVVGEVEHFPTRCGVGQIVAGPDGSVWFSCFNQALLAPKGTRSVIGKVTPTGAVTEYELPAGVAAADMVTGSDGNLWFSDDDGDEGTGRSPGLGPSAIGRITPTGEVTVFRAGLRPRSRPQEIVAGPEGDLWFVDAGDRPEIGRITTAGTITEFPTGLRAPLGLGGIAVGAEGSTWFTQAYVLPHFNQGRGVAGRLEPSGTVAHFGKAPAAISAPVIGADGNVWFVDDAGKGATLDRLTPGGQLTRFSKGLTGFPTSLTSGSDGNVWFTAQRSIGRVTPDGNITQFTDCLTYRQYFSEALGIVPGAEGNLWFTSVTSRELPAMGEAPTIGWVTPSGAITTLKAGVGPQPRSIVAGADGGIWFSGGSPEISRVEPPRAPVNTFILDPGYTTTKGVAHLPFELPGPGTVEVGKVELLLPHERTLTIPPGSARRFSASSCGATSMLLHLHGKVLDRQQRGRTVRMRITATFTPTGGSPNTRTETTVVRYLGHRR